MAKPIKHIAVIRLSALGDVAMLVPVLLAVLKANPNLKITVVTKAFNAPIFKDIDGVEVVVAKVKAEHKGIPGMYRLAGQLKALGIDAVADTHQVLRSKMLRNFLRVQGCKVAYLDKGRPQKKALIKAPNNQIKPLISTHERYAQVFKNLGLALDWSNFTPLERKPMPQAILELLDGYKGKLIGIAPFAAFNSKTYSEALMQETLVKLESAGDKKVLLFGGPADKAALLHIAQGLKRVIVVAGLLSFKEELALISNLDLMVSMDSGNGHLAANYGVPVLTLWGVTHPYLGFAPFGQPESHWLLPDLEKYPQIPTSVYGKNNPAGYDKAINSIPVAQLVSKINEFS